MSAVPSCDHEATTTSGDIAHDNPKSNSDLQFDTLKARGDKLLAAYRASCSEATIEHVIDIYEEALCLRPEGHVRRAESLNDLGDALYHFCLNHKADETRRNHCIELLRDSLRLRPPGNPLRDISLHNLSKALRFALSHQQNDLNILVECASLNREALRLRPSGHPERGMSLNSLAVDLMRMVQHTGDMENLPEIVSMYREVLQTRLPGHPMRHTSLNNLATALCMIFKHSARSEHLAEAISVYREVMQLRPRGHPMRHTALQGLAYALTLRSVDEGHSESLAEAIQLQRECLELLPDSHSHRSMNMGNLAESLLASFHSSGDANALAEAISLSREAVTLHSPMDCVHDNVLNILAQALEAKLNKDSDIETVTEVADLYREVLRRRPIGHWRRSWSLEGLARVLCKSGSSLWPEALTCYQEALQICPMEGPERSRLWSGMSACFLDTNSPLFSLSEGVACLSKAYAHSFLHVNERLKSAISALEHLETACRTSTQCAHSEAGTPDDERILELYAQVIGLLPLAANFGLDHGARLQAVAGTDEIARNAATRALLLGNFSQAIEMMELGRGVFWMQTLHLHTTAFDGVPKDDCQELQQMLRMLTHAARRADIGDQSAVQYEQELERRRKLNDAVQAIITRIRGYPGLDRFLLPPVFDVLLGSLPDGFVVIVNTSKLGNHALLLHRATGLKTSLPLQPFPTGFDCAKLRAQLPRDGVSASGKEGDIETRAMRLDNGRVGNLEDVLSLLWTSIASPVLEGLSLNQAEGRARPRLWWCVTGELGFLPIHAAGRCRDASAVCATNYVVSSYIPTLASLVKARTLWAPITRTDLTGLLICESLTTGSPAAHLPHAEDEVAVVREFFATAGAQVLNQAATHTSVLELPGLLIREPAHVLHMACHGIHDANPLKSAFMLGDGKLSIEDIIQLNLPHAFLAFLSACQTAKGDRNAPDQAVHLAASMLFCGFRSVVGTMWSMCDKDGPRIARQFYSSLFEKDQVDLDDIAYALDDAVQVLRKSSVPASRWASFMHIGG